MLERLWNTAYFQRDYISFISAAFLIAIALLVLVSKPAPPPDIPTISEMKAFLAPEEPMPEPLPQPVVEAKPQPVQKETVKNTAPIEKVTPHQEPVRQPDIPAQTPVQQTPSEQAPVQQAAETAHKQTDAPPVSAKPETQAKPQEIPQKPEVQQASVSAKYEAYVLAYLEKSKRYPTSREARQSRPQGIVKIWLEINRTGAVVGYGIEQSSGSNLLDSEALKVAKYGEFPPFPEGSYLNDSTHRFIASLKYEVN
jgi:periplasmic protein TonB